jgi:GH24 family phage-related lysozyme (muramidase)
MSLKESRALWRAREQFRLNKWRFYRYTSKRPSDERMELRKKWYDLYQEARTQRILRDRQLREAQHATKMSDEGLKMLMRSEGSVPYAYNDPANHATFGVGHLLHRGPVTAADQRAWGTKANPKRDRVLPVLKEDIRKFETGVLKALKKPASQKQLDALVHFAFNIGMGGFESSSVLRRHNAGDREGAANAFRLWAKPDMLKGRREKERALYLGGPYS